MVAPNNETGQAGVKVLTMNEETAKLIAGMGKRLDAYKARETLMAGILREVAGLDWYPHDGNHHDGSECPVCVVLARVESLVALLDERDRINQANGTK